jgi:hypothetical protein
MGEASCPGLTRASIFFVLSIASLAMDCRVKPGNDEENSAHL